MSFVLEVLCTSYSLSSGPCFSYRKLLLVGSNLLERYKYISTLQIKTKSSTTLTEYESEYELCILPPIYSMYHRGAQFHSQIN